ncbi:unnamed protein product [Rotaria magnacalcarata]|uniref:Uncharacterized protein n=1 Tax=Rotaria magnacalcarata TaxID=392030 RepID=A0A817A4B0_9BILA|nr:unnamed protein product [Rotaria magnacalcarata]CAF2248540.1 unnamed protein product [Rotaria magnacalcarata]
MTAIERLINCGICHRRLNDPRILSCSHTYCLRCIRENVSIHSNYFECPQNDGAKVSKNFIGELAVDQTACDMIESIALTDGTIPCSNCDSIVSEHWCSNCIRSYCAKCCREIHEMPALEDHHIVPLREKLAEFVPCKSHSDEKLKYWCLKCNAYVCSDCILDTHQDHPYTFIRRIADDLQKKVNDDLSKIESTLTRNLTETDTSITKINDEHQEKISLISNSMKFLKQILEQHEEELLRKVENIDQDNNQLMEDFRIRLQNELECLENHKTILGILQSSRDPMKIIRARQGFIDYTDRIKRILVGLRLPAMHNYHIEGIDQIQIAREKILDCGKFIEGLIPTNTNIDYSNQRLESLIVDYQTKEEWSFEKRYLTDQDMKIIADALKENTVATKLDLSQCKIDDQGIQRLADALRLNKTLKLLYLHKNQINDYGTQYLAESLTYNKTLTKLDLSQNIITDQGIQSLSNMLQQNRTLTILHLSQNQIRDQGAQYLANALRQNHTLKTLHLSQNLIADQGAQHLANALTQNKTLTTLNLYWNDIGDLGAESFVHTLQTNNNLHTLLLSRNRIGNDSAKQFIDVLKQNTTLTALSLHENRIDQQTQNYGKNILKIHKGRVTVNW